MTYNVFGETLNFVQLNSTQASRSAATLPIGSHVVQLTHCLILGDLPSRTYTFMARGQLSLASAAAHARSSCITPLDQGSVLCRRRSK